MPNKIVLEPDAYKDIESTYFWYEGEKQGLGERFESLFYHKLNLIEKNPEIGQVVYKDFRRILMFKFPFAIYYKLNLPEITVFACLDIRRDPDSIVRRLH